MPSLLLRLRAVLVVCSVALVALLTGCEQSPSTDISSPTEDLTLLESQTKHSGLDRELKQVLLAAAEGQGLQYFRLPLSHQLRRIPQDPKNRLTPAKVKLGRFLYHETALAVNNVRPEGRETYSCAACHHAAGGFQANVPQGVAEGGLGFGPDGSARTFDPNYDSNPDVPDCQPIRSPTAMNTAYQALMLWNGQFGGVGDNLGTEDRWKPGTPLESNFLGLEGLETQAHAGLKVHRMGDIELSRVAEIKKYRGLFRAAFRGQSEPINRLNAALAIAAYERTLLANRAPFQRWLRGNKRAMSNAEKRGAVLFFGKANCVSCHTGPALSSMTFHALGMNDLDGAYDAARVNLAPFGSTVPDDVRRGRGGFTGNSADDYKFKTPQLYNLLDSPFYGHGASFSTVREVVEYKNAATAQAGHVPASQLAEGFEPLGLGEDEISDLVAFLSSALYDGRLQRYVPKRLPSGNDFPVADPQVDGDGDRHRDIDDGDRGRVHAPAVMSQR